MTAGRDLTADDVVDVMQAWRTGRRSVDQVTAELNRIARGEGGERAGDDEPRLDHFLATLDRMVNEDRIDDPREVRAALDEAQATIRRLRAGGGVTAGQDPRHALDAAAARLSEAYALLDGINDDQSQALDDLSGTLRWAEPTSMMDQVAHALLGLDPYSIPDAVAPAVDTAAPDPDIRCGPECSEQHTYVIGRCEAAGTVAPEAGPDLITVSLDEVWSAVLTSDGGQPDGVIPSTAQCNRAVGMLRRRSAERDAAARERLLDAIEDTAAPDPLRDAGDELAAAALSALPHQCACDTCQRLERAIDAYKATRSGQAPAQPDQQDGDTRD